MINLKKYPLKWTALASLVVLVLTIIFVSIFGVKTSIEVGGGSQIEIRLTYSQNDSLDAEKISEVGRVGDYVAGVKKVLKKHNASVDSYLVEDKLIDTYLVVKIDKTNIKNADSISSEIATRLGIDASRVSDVITLGSYFSNSVLLWTGLGILTVVIVLFFAAWLRYGLMAGITMPLAFLYNIIMSLAVIFLLRVQFSMVSFVSVVVLSLLVVWVLSLMFERVKENSKSSAYSDYTNEQHFFKATKQVWQYGLIAAVILVACLVLVCVPIKYVQLAALSVIFADIVAAVTAAIVAPGLQCYLQQVYTLRPERKKKVKKAKNAKTKK